MNKKGISSLIVITIFFFLLAMISIPIIQINANLEEVIEDTDFSDNAKSHSAELEQSSINFYDNAAFFFIIGLFIITIVLSLSINSTAAFFWVSAIILIFLIPFSAMLSNQYYDYIQDVDNAATNEKLTFIPHVMEFWPFYVLGYGILIIVLTFGKSRFTSGDFG